MRRNIEQIKNAKILVVGDIMLDIYLQGSANRISPEAPVPVVVANKKDALPGGAANVMRNLRSLGCSVSGAGFVGNDHEGTLVLNHLINIGVNVECICKSKFNTIHKTRVLANGQHIVRFDFDSEFNDDKERKTLEDMISSLMFMKKFDAIIVSDYAKGTVFQSLMDTIKQSPCPVVGDLKPQHKEMFHKVWSITPNLQEAKDILGINSRGMTPIEMARKIKKDMELKTSIITLADHGIVCVDENDNEYAYPAYIDTINDPRHILDVTGAGDTVISTLAACVAVGLPTSQSVIASNIAAGVVVRKIGTATCSFEELTREIENYDRIISKV